MAREIPQGGPPKDIPSVSGPKGESLSSPINGGITGLPSRSETFPDPSWEYKRESEPVIVSLEDNGDDPGEGKRTQNFSPRTQKAGAAITAFASLTTMMSPVHRPTELGPIFEPPYVFGQDYSHTPDLYNLSTDGAPVLNNGVVETPRGDFPIEGLAIHVDPEDFPTSPGVAIRVSTVEENPRDFDYDEVIDDAHAWATGDTALFVEEGETASQYGKPLGLPNDGYSFLNSPNQTKNEPADLRVSGANDGAFVVETIDTTTQHVVDTEVYDAHISPTDVCADGTQVVMAVEAPQYVDGLCDIADLYADYTDGPTRVIVNQATDILDRKSHLDPDDRIMRFSLPEENDEEGFDLSNDVKVHEFAHVVHEQLSEESRDQIAGAHQILTNNMRYRMPTFEETSDYDVSKNEPVWGIFTETTYYRMIGREDIGGHPQDAPTELFASVTNTVRTFPDLVQDQFMTLRPNEQHAAGIALVEVADAYLSQNPDPEALRRLMPELGSTLAVMSQNPASQYYRDRMAQLQQLLG